MDDQLLNTAVQMLGTIGGLSVVISLVVQFLVKPGLSRSYATDEEKAADRNYPFNVNVWTAVVSLLLAALGLFALDGIPADAAGWATAVGNIVVGAILAGLGSIGVESLASNVKRRFS